MSNVASFRELKGVGPITEAKLHEAGVYTWEALSEVLDALGNVRGSTGDTLRELSEQVASRSAVGDASFPYPPTGERSEAFIVRMSLAPDGQPTRSSVTSTALVADIAEFEYRATLAGSAYGQIPEAGSAWTALAERTGRSHPPDRLPLRFDAVKLPQGLQRLRLEMALRLPVPRREAPALALG